MDKNDIAGLIEALCEAPLDGGAPPSAELAALRREAARLLGDGGDDARDAEALVTALATVLSGSANDAARKRLAELVTRSAPARLDADSALAFVETVERSAETAPAHLVEEFFETEAATRPHTVAESFWSRIGRGVRPAYRIVAACSVVILASAASWSLYWHEHEQLAGPPAPANIELKASEVPPPAMVKSESRKTEGTKAVPTVADAPAPPPAAVPQPALAARQNCEPRTRALEALRTRSSAPAAEKKAKDVPSGCDATPADDADAAIKQAREDAERARQNAGVPVGAAPASAAIGSVQTEIAPAQAGRADPADRARRPAATAPAAKPATPPRELSR